MGLSPAPIMRKVTASVTSEMQVSVANVPEEGSQALKILAGGIELAFEVSMADVNPGAKITVESIDGRSVVRGGVRSKRRLAQDAQVVFEVTLPFFIVEGQEIPSDTYATEKATEALEALSDIISQDNFDVQNGMEKFVDSAVKKGELEGDTTTILEDAIQTVGEVNGKDTGDITIEELDVGDPEGYSKVICTSDSDCDAGFKCVLYGSMMRRRLFGNLAPTGECQWQGD